MSRIQNVLRASLLFVALQTASFPLARAETADEIIQKAEANGVGGASTQTLTLVLYDKAGTARSRVLDSRIRKFDGVLKTYGRITSPSDMAGIQFLTLQNPKGEDEQYVFFPGAGVSRITGAGRRTAFLGSDFSYEDLQLGQSQDATHRLLGEESLTLSGQSIPCWKLESVPKPELKSQYARIITWIAKDGAVPRMMSLMDAQSREVKRMTVLRIVREGTSIIPAETEMKSLLKGTRTVLRVDKYRMNLPSSELPDSMFTAAYLEQAH